MCRGASKTKTLAAIRWTTHLFLSKTYLVRVNTFCALMRRRKRQEDVSEPAPACVCVEYSNLPP